MDPRVMNKCPTLSGRDTEWSEWSLIFESVAAMANLEPAMEGAFAGLAEKPLAELTPEMKPSAKQLYCLLVITVRGTTSQHGNVSRPSTSLTQLDDTQQCSWERRIQEYEGESLETFSDDMKIAVLASHAPESIRNMV